MTGGHVMAFKKSHSIQVEMGKVIEEILLEFQPGEKSRSYLIGTDRNVCSTPNIVGQTFLSDNPLETASSNTLIKEKG